MIADTILIWLGENPAAYPQANDKWPVIFADIFFYSLPVIFIALFVGPAIWMFWYKKVKFTFKNVVKALLRGVFSIFLGLVALYFLMSYLQGLAFNALNS